VEDIAACLDYIAATPVDYIHVASLGDIAMVSADYIGVEFLGDIAVASVGYIGVAFPDYIGGLSVGIGCNLETQSAGTAGVDCRHPKQPLR